MKSILMMALLAIAFIIATSTAYAQNAKPAAKPKPAQSATVRKTNTTAAKSKFVEPEMVFVEGGTFTMGCTSEQGNDCSDEEKPAHQVTLSSFYIGKYEVTQAQWLAVMGKSPEFCNYSRNGNSPASGLQYYAIQEFIRKLNVKTGKQYRLPTEAEWEYAARGGNQSKGYKYSGSNNLGDVAWYGEDSSKGYTSYPVGKKLPNELGIYDMSGNLEEYCSNEYDTYNSQAQTNPQGSPGKYKIAVRGGEANSDASRCRVSAREYADTNNEYGWDNFGFRLAISSK